MAKKKQKLEDKLAAKKETAWKDLKKAEEKRIFDFAEDYKKFLTESKTERETVEHIIAAAEKEGFKPLDKYKKLKAGDKVLFSKMGKLVALAVMGKEPLERGMKVVASHIDSPRVDLKQQPLYEDSDSELALFKTHYYGGIKKYQWANIPLALHGIIIKEDGESVKVNIGEDPQDPVFVIGDLLPHLSHKAQAERKMRDVLKGEELRVIIGNRPYTKDEDANNKLKLNVLEILNKKYGIVEEDLISAELQVVPASPARDVGLDRSMVGGYGHDDRICAYASMRAIFDVSSPKHTALTLFFDKEEVGSIGATGAQGGFFEMAVAEIMEKAVPEYRYAMLKRAMSHSRALSGDVDAAVHPMFKGVHDIGNACKLGHGLAVCKFGGARGKSGSNDANAEFLGELRRLLNKKKIPWQYTALGKVDEGGGGTVARFLSEHNLEVIDCGPGVVSMHSPFEIISKIDLYCTYRGYTEFQKAD